MRKVAVVTGGTAGIGKQTALALKAAGYTVYELSRRAQGVEGLHHLVADITREELVDAAIGCSLQNQAQSFRFCFHRCQMLRRSSESGRLFSNSCFI